MSGAKQNVMAEILGGGKLLNSRQTGNGQPELEAGEQEFCIMNFVQVAPTSFESIQYEFIDGII